MIIFAEKSQYKMAGDPPQPRLCQIAKVDNFDGFGFNLHAEKNKPGQFVGKIDVGSPAEVAGLKEGDRNGECHLIILQSSNLTTPTLAVENQNNFHNLTKNSLQSIWLAVIKVLFSQSTSWLKVELAGTKCLLTGGTVGGLVYKLSSCLSSHSIPGVYKCLHAQTPRYIFLHLTLLAPCLMCPDHFQPRTLVKCSYNQMWTRCHFSNPIL